MSRSRIFLILLALALAAYVALSVAKVPSDRIGVRDSIIPGTSPAVVSEGWSFVPLGLAHLTLYPAGPASFAFGQDEPLILVSPEGSRIAGAGKLEYRIAAGQAAALHAACGGDLDRFLIEKIRAALTDVVSEPSFSPSDASNLPEAESAARELLAGADGIHISGLSLDSLGYEGSASASDNGPRASVRRKLIWFAVDSFDWNIARPLMDAGRMPNLKRLMDEGAWGDLRTVVPIVSPVIWTSAATGKQPAKHGIIDFVATDPKTGSLVPVTSTLRKTRAIWNILSNGGVSVGMVAWWASFPAETVNGFIVTDRVSYQLFKDRVQAESADDPFKTYPSDLYARIEPMIEAPAAVTNEQLSRFIDVARYGSRFSADDKDRVREFATALAAAHTYTAVGEKLFSDRPTDFRAIYFEGPDEASHIFMPFVPPAIKTVDAGKEAWFGGVVDAYYAYQDELLGRFLDAFADDETTILVSSDHGFKTGDARPATESRISHGKATDWHRPDGMILLSGKDIKKGVRIAGASVLDIVPTLLCLYGMPVGDDMDGKPLTMAIDDDFLAAHPPSRVATYDTGPPTTAPAVDYDSEAGREALEKLRGLGYIAQDQPSAHFNQGAVDLQSGDYDKAIAEFLASLRQTDDADVRFSLARAYRLSGRLDDASGQIEILQKRNWRPGLVYNEMALILRERKDYAGAEKLLKQALAADPGSADAHVNLGRLYAEQKRWDESLASFEKAAELDPNSGEAFNQIAVVQKQLGRTDEAVASLQQAIKVDPGLTGPYNNLGILYGESGRMDKAIEILKQGIAMAPKSAMLRNSLASLYYKQGDAARATKELEAALEIDPDYTQALSNLSTIYLALRDAARAETPLTRLTELEPDNTSAKLSLAMVLSELKRSDEGKRILRDLLAKNPQDARAMLAFGEIELAASRPAEAAGWLERSSKIDGNNPRVWNDLARCYLAMGRKDDAREAMRRSLAADPKQPGVDKKLRELGG